MRILNVEDEQRISQQISKALSKTGFTVDTCESIEDAQALTWTETYNAMIVDRLLPDGDGIEFVRDIRRRGLDLPVLFLTARDTIEDRIVGLDSGADDYLVKPFAMSELVARMRALLRRPGSVFGRTETVGELCYSFHTRVATVGGVPLPLPRHELLVLENLVRNRSHVVTKAELLDNVYGLDVPDSNTIPVHIYNLRRKLKSMNGGVEIHTFRGLGYMLDDT